MPRGRLFTPDGGREEWQSELLPRYARRTREVDERAARRAWLRFTTKWKKLCPAVVESLEEAGAELLTFYRFPESPWKDCARPTSWSA